MNFYILFEALGTMELYFCIHRRLISAVTLFLLLLISFVLLLAVGV